MKDVEIFTKFSTEKNFSKIVYENSKFREFSMLTENFANFSLNIENLKKFSLNSENCL